MAKSSELEDDFPADAGAALGALPPFAFSAILVALDSAASTAGLSPFGADLVETGVAVTELISEMLIECPP